MPDYGMDIIFVSVSRDCRTLRFVKYVLRFYQTKELSKRNILVSVLFSLSCHS